MSVQALGGPVRTAGPCGRLRLEHVVMGGAVLCLMILVVLPLLSLLLGSVRGEEGLSLDNFAEVADRPALRQRAQEFAHPRRLDRPVQPRHRRFAGLGGEPHRRSGQAVDPDHRHAVLSVAAVPDRDRLRLSVQPECRPDQRAAARRAGAAVADLQHLLDDRAWCWSRCCTPFRSSICWPRARCSRSTPPTRRRRKSSAPASCAPR